MRAEAYYNLHKQCLSYRPIGGRVKHADELFFSNVKFVVQPAGRDRVLTEGRKNVHAFVRGDLEFIVPLDETERFYKNNDPVVMQAIDDTYDDVLAATFEITYNPYLFDSFVIKSSGRAIKSARFVIVQGKRIYAIGVR